MNCSCLYEFTESKRLKDLDLSGDRATNNSITESWLSFCHKATAELVCVCAWVFGWLVGWTTWRRRPHPSFCQDTPLSQKIQTPGKGDAISSKTPSFFFAPFFRLHYFLFFFLLVPYLLPIRSYLLFLFLLLFLGNTSCIIEDSGLALILERVGFIDSTTTGVDGVTYILRHATPHCSQSRNAVTRMKRNVHFYFTFHHFVFFKLSSLSPTFLLKLQLLGVLRTSSGAIWPRFVGSQNHAISA